MNPRGAHYPPQVRWGQIGMFGVNMLVLLVLVALLVAGVVPGVGGKAETPVKAQKMLATPSRGSTPSPAPASSPTVLYICGGLEPQPAPDVTLTVSRADALRARDSVAEEEFGEQVKRAFAAEATRRVGVAEVFGGGYGGGADVSSGIHLAAGAIEALKRLGAQGFLFASNTVYQAFWDGHLASNQIEMIVFLYQTPRGGACTTSGAT